MPEPIIAVNFGASPGDPPTVRYLGHVLILDKNVNDQFARNELEKQMAEKSFSVYTIEEVDFFTNQLDAQIRSVEANVKDVKETTLKEVLKAINDIPQKLLSEEATNALREAVLIELRRNLDELRQDLQAQIDEIRQKLA